jgi:hypothetical protein
VHGLHQMYNRLSNHFGRSEWYFKVTRLKCKLILVHLETLLILTQDRYIVSTEQPIGLEIILDASEGTPW